MYSYLADPVIYSQPRTLRVHSWADTVALSRLAVTKTSRKEEHGLKSLLAASGRAIQTQSSPATSLTASMDGQLAWVEQWLLLVLK
jgi:hypothetical protein